MARWRWRLGERMARTKTRTGVTRGKGSWRLSPLVVTEVMVTGPEGEEGRELLGKNYVLVINFQEK